jgi:Putative zinc-finger
MVVNCERVWHEISNYLEGEVDPTLRTAMDEHIKGCKDCTAVLAGMRNIIAVYGDERLQEVPLGFGQRLHRKLEENMPGQRGGAFGWVLAFAAILLIVGSVKLGTADFYNPELRSEHADPAKSSIPDDMLVVVSADGKVFHGSKRCPFILDKANLRTMTAKEAVREGYAPCVRCMHKYMAIAPPPPWLEQQENDEDVQAEAGHAP